MKEFYITDKAGNYFEDIDEAINNTLEEIKNCYQYTKVKSFKYNINAQCEKRTKYEVKITKAFFNSDYFLSMLYMNMEKWPMAKIRKINKWGLWLWLFFSD